MQDYYFSEKEKRKFEEKVRIPDDLISANNLDSRVINGYFIKISNLNVPYIT